jgi:hypothetical protein
MYAEMIRSWFLVVLVFNIFSTLVDAQEIYVDIQCSNPYPGVGEQIKLSYILKLKMQNGMASVSHSGIKVKKPSFGNVNILQEGSESSMFSFGNMGGDMQLSKYSFILQPTAKGKVIIEGLTFIMNGKEYVSKTFVINVGEGDPNLKIVPQNANLFVRIETAKSEIFVGEHTLVTYKLYSHYSNVSVQNYDFPMAKGFWTEEIASGKQGWPQTQENIGGKGYLVVPLKKEIVFGRAAGDIQLPAITLDLVVGGTVFSPGTKETIKSNAPTIKVKALPSNAPVGFANQVGKGYKMEVSYSTQELKANEPLDIKIKITGEGNLRQLDEVSLNLPTDFEQYDAEIIDNTKLSPSGIAGSKQFNYLVIPRHHGKYELPEIGFSYYDLSAKKYITLTSPSTTIIVNKADGAVSFSGNSSVVKSDVELLNSGIRHIHYTSKLRPIKDVFFGSFEYWSIVSLPFLWLGGFFLVGKLLREKEEQPSHKKASKTAIKLLADAQKQLDNKDDKAFYAAMDKALLDFLSISCKLPISELSSSSIETNLRVKQVPEETIHQLNELLEDCAIARFAPTTLHGASSSMMRAVETIKIIEKYVK